MRWIIATACLISLTIGVALIAYWDQVTRPPVGGIAILFIGVVVSWGFAGVGAYAWLRRPENKTGVLMACVGALTAFTGMQFFDTPALYAIGMLFDTVVISGLIHLLLAFPTGRVEGTAARRIVAAASPAPAAAPGPSRGRRRSRRRRGRSAACQGS